jgi:hypothetical protein
MQSYVPVVTVNLPQQRYLEAILNEYVRAEKVKIESRLLRDSALAAAESFLLQYPDRHVAIVLETHSTEPDDIMEFDASTRRRVSLADPSGDRWHLALAIPRLDAWALVDDHIRQQVQQAGIWQDPETASLQIDRQKIENSNYLNLASKISSFVQAHPFNLEALKHKSRQCRELCEFIERSLTPATVPASASDWF